MKTMQQVSFSMAEIEAEARRLHEKLGRLEFGLAECMAFAPYTLEINRLKKEKNAVILAHNYQRPEIIYGVADFTADSLALSKAAQATDADMIVFCGVHFMAETAKILNPSKKVLLPDLEAGCSLSESITAQDVRELRKKFPGVPVVTYVNTSAEVKAESDVVCTSANATRIVNAMGSDTVIFLPDEFMAKNLESQTSKKIISWSGKCIVHEQFTEGQIVSYKKTYPGLKVLVHTECTPAVVKHADMAGSTSQMQKYVESTNAKQLMLVTECGMADMLKARHPEKDFIAPCIICPYMKKNHLENILASLREEKFEIKVGEATRKKALKAVQRMLDLSG